MATNGRNILVYNNSVTPAALIGGMKSNEVQTECELQEISSPGDGEWKHYIKGRKSGSIQVGYLVLASSALDGGSNPVQDLLKVGTTYTLVFKGRGNNDTTGVKGDYILKTCKINSVIGNLVTGSFQFVLNGALVAPSS